MTDKNIVQFPNKLIQKNTPKESNVLTRKIQADSENIIGGTLDPIEKMTLEEAIIQGTKLRDELIKEIDEKNADNEELIHNNFHNKQANNRLKKEVNALKKKINDLIIIGKTNEDLQSTLHDIFLELGNPEIDTIPKAILFLSSAFSESFDVSMKIILTPQYDENGNRKENSVAQMLADMIDLRNARAENPTDHPDMTYDKEIDTLTSLLPIAQGALHGYEKEQEIFANHMERGFINHGRTPYFLSKQDIQDLNPQIFGNTQSALALSIDGIGEMMFLSDDPTRYAKDMSSSILKQNVESIGISLHHIGEKDEHKKDFLTGLLLRRIFTGKAEKLLLQKQGKKQSISFAMVDIDHFKRVNDNYGHPAGDLVIKTLAKVLRREFKEEDLVVRWGGEEFGILLLKTTAKQAAKAIERAFIKMKKIEFVKKPDGTVSIINTKEKSEMTDKNGLPKEGYKIFSITMSAGVQEVSAIKAEALDSKKSLLDVLVQEADKKLYQAKGKNEEGGDRIGEDGKVDGRDRIIYNGDDKRNVTIKLGIIKNEV